MASTRCSTFCEVCGCFFVVRGYFCNFYFSPDYYPHFEIVLDPADRLQSAYYVDVYSLLLHFACVRYPQTELQTLCNGLNNESQVRIAAFFTALLMEQTHINHAVIQMAIGESASIKCQRGSDADLMSPLPCGRDSSSASSSSDGNGAGGGKKASLFSPPTPRTKMLNDWNLENKMLKVCIMAVVLFDNNGF